jgi:hypothetical protein
LYKRAIRRGGQVARLTQWNTNVRTKNFCI